MTSAYIYCASDGERVKVGWSRGPHARVKDLRRRNPGLALVRAWPVSGRHDAFVLEQIIHRDTFGRKHSWDGEWYAVPADDAVARIDATVTYWSRLWSRQYRQSTQQRKAS